LRTGALASFGLAVVIGVTLVYPTTTDQWANKVTVWGLYLALVALALTVWTVLETQRSSKISAERTEAAVALSRQETRQTLQKIALQLLREECEAISRLIPDALRAADGKDWNATIEKLQEAKRLAARLQQSGQLFDPEKEIVKAGASDLELIISHVRGKQPKNLEAPGLASTKREPLEKMTSQVEIILARLRQQLLEPPHAD